jgi:hypothetical protein
VPLEPQAFESETGEPGWLHWWRETSRRGGDDHWLTRFVVLRLLGLVYFVAYLGIIEQWPALLGSRGLTPVPAFLARAKDHFSSTLEAVVRLPSLFWLDASDACISCLAWLGALLSLAVLLGYANAVMLALLWVIYLSFVHVGQVWYSFGWEIQLCETGFLCVFLVPLLDGRPFPRRAPSMVVIWLLRWLIVRIMLGAGLIKLRGDDCWRALTCLDYHFETQPLPNPLSRTLHFLPHRVHAAGVLLNHLTELVAPWFAFGPRRARHLAAAAMLLLQLGLIASGNLSFLNYLTIVPILGCFDDRLLRRLLPRRLAERADRARREAEPSEAGRVATSSLFALVLVLSIFPVANLLSSRQAMNESFTPLDLVNTYGAFGSVNRERYQLVFEGTLDREIGPATVWQPYEFRCQPGDVDRRPCVVAPYHLRLDWLLWFAAMGGPEEYPWAIRLVAKLLENDRATLGLMAHNPFASAPPHYVRVLLYRYQFAAGSGAPFWQRQALGSWLPPVSQDEPALGAFLANR